MSDSRVGAVRWTTLTPVLALVVLAASWGRDLAWAPAC